MDTLKSIFGWVRENEDPTLYCVFGFVVLLLIVALVISYFQIRKWKKAEEGAHNEWIYWKNQTKEWEDSSNTFVKKYQESAESYQELKEVYKRCLTDRESLQSFKDKSDKGFREHIRVLTNGLRLKALQQAVIVAKDQQTLTGGWSWKEYVDPIYKYLTTGR
jgi:predicted Holliday junction resolvase-like endonuclease